MKQRIPFKCIGIAEAETILKRGDAVIVDVRDAGSYSRARIDGAKLVSMRNISDVMASIAHDTPVLIYCYRGHASREYAQVFSDFGFGEVYSLDGGYEAWKARPKLAADGTIRLLAALQKWLAAQGFPANEVDAVITNDTTPLMKASHMGDIAVVRMLIAAGASLNARNADGNNALWLACVGKHLEVIEVLVDAGIDMNNRNDNGATPLMYAASSGKADVIEILLAKGADTAPETLDGFSALDLASTVECLRLLRTATRSATDKTAADRTRATVS